MSIIIAKFRLAKPYFLRYTEIVLLKTVPCPGGGIGRRTGLKILRALKPMPVQVRPWAPFKKY
jgi:hypothetical protein